ncbi:hypothetical protein GOODEAATRI_031668 [Goodea atripinnis]|uniref:Uncharacterized protein n=1 Tax=Goodea atripinnis TaxID=208336 RepID=A0ABV0PIT9_9TELE
MNCLIVCVRARTIHLSRLQVSIKSHVHFCEIIERFILSPCSDHTSSGHAEATGLVSTVIQLKQQGFGRLWQVAIMVVLAAKLILVEIRGGGVLCFPCSCTVQSQTQVCLCVCLPCLA